jgi:DNA-binding response OmpR family regulator
MVEAATAAAREQRGTSSKASIHATRAILVADDDRAMREMVAAALRLDGYEVVEAGSGEELLYDVRARLDYPAGGHGGIGLIVTDLRMPGLSGFDILAWLRAAGSSTPVVVMTAFGSAEARAEVMRLGAIALLDKPFALERLRDVARRAIARR